MKANMKKISLIAATLGLAIGGTSLGLMHQAKASTGNTASEQTSENAAVNISQTDAVNKFNERFGSKSIEEIELKHKKNRYVYEIEGFDATKEYKIKIDANNGNVLKADSESRDSDDHESALDLNNLISRQQATQIAQSKAAGNVEEWSLEMKKDRPVWNIELKNGHAETEVEIDAKTQSILKIKNDDNHKKHADSAENHKQ